MPKVEKSGNISIQQLIDSVTNNQENEYIDELRKSDENNRTFQLKIQELTEKNDTIVEDLKTMSECIDSRDREILRLSSLYQEDVHIDKITEV